MAGVTTWQDRDWVWDRWCCWRRALSRTDGIYFGKPLCSVHLRDDFSGSCVVFFGGEWQRLVNSHPLLPLGCI